MFNSSPASTVSSHTTLKVCAPEDTLQFGLHESSHYEVEPKTSEQAKRRVDYGTTRGEESCRPGLGPTGLVTIEHRGAKVQAVTNQVDVAAHSDARLASALTAEDAKDIAIDA